MLSAFLLLTIFPQLVAVTFFTFLQDPVFPFDKSGGSLMLLFLVSELFVGKRSVDKLIQRQTAQFFRLCQEEEFQRIERTDGPELLDKDNEQQRKSVLHTTHSLPEEDLVGEKEETKNDKPKTTKASLLSQVLRRRLHARECTTSEERQGLLSSPSPTKNDDDEVKNSTS